MLGVSASRRPACSRLGFLPPSSISVPVHPHLRDLPLLRLAEDRAPRVYLFTRAAASESATELRGEPWSRDVNLTRRKADLGLVERDVLPVHPYGVDATVGLAEGRLEEYGIIGEDRSHGIEVAALPALAERVDQYAKGFAHGRKYSPIRV